MATSSCCIILNDNLSLAFLSFVPLSFSSFTFFCSFLPSFHSSSPFPAFISSPPLHSHSFLLSSISLLYILSLCFPSFLLFFFYLHLFIVPIVLNPVNLYCCRLNHNIRISLNILSCPIPSSFHPGRGVIGTEFDTVTLEVQTRTKYTEIIINSDGIKFLFCFYSCDDARWSYLG